MVYMESYVTDEELSQATEDTVRAMNYDPLFRPGDWKFNAEGPNKWPTLGWMRAYNKRLFIFGGKDVGAVWQWDKWTNSNIYGSVATCDAPTPMDCNLKRVCEQFAFGPTRTLSYINNFRSDALAWDLWDVEREDEYTELTNMLNTCLSRDVFGQDYHATGIGIYTDRTVESVNDLKAKHIKTIFDVINERNATAAQVAAVEKETHEKAIKEGLAHAVEELLTAQKTNTGVDAAMKKFAQAVPSVIKAQDILTKATTKQEKDDATYRYTIAWAEVIAATVEEKRIAKEHNDTPDRVLGYTSNEARGAAINTMNAYNAASKAAMAAKTFEMTGQPADYPAKKAAADAAKKAAEETAKKAANDAADRAIKAASDAARKVKQAADKIETETKHTAYMDAKKAKLAADRAAKEAKDAADRAAKDEKKASTAATRDAKIAADKAARDTAKKAADIAANTPEAQLKFAEQQLAQASTSKAKQVATDRYIDAFATVTASEKPEVKTAHEESDKIAADATKTSQEKQAASANELKIFGAAYDQAKQAKTLELNATAGSR
jgi:hypothetical protein